MEKIEYLFFDCMETLVDMDNLPETKDYASWSYHGSGVEKYWDDFNHFCEHYINDHQVPASLGMKTILFKPEKNYKDVKYIANNFYEIENTLNQIEDTG